MQIFDKEQKKEVSTDVNKQNIIIATFEVVVIIFPLNDITLCSSINSQLNNRYSTYDSYFVIYICLTYFWNSSRSRLHRGHDDYYTMMIKRVILFKKNKKKDKFR